MSLRELYLSCDCYKEQQYHRIVSMHSDDQSHNSSEVASSAVSANSRQSRVSQASKSTLNISLKKISERLFDNKSVNSFADQVLLQRESIRKAAERSQNCAIQEMDSQLSNHLSISRRTNTSGVSKLTMSLLNLDNSDFPDVCMLCE